MSRRAATAQTVATRTAVAASVADLPGDGAVVIACSGGADSLALAAAAAWVAPRRGLHAEAVVVDHNLQPGSDGVAADAAAACAALGLPSRVIRVDVGRKGGPESAARDARLAALQQAAEEVGATAILLGHTLEDQAETVLLRLARGSGARSLAAMAARRDPWRRPFLGLPRGVVRAAAADALAPLGLSAWDDPHNDDAAFARVRVRRLLAELEGALGAGIVAGLARSAELLRDDADALDEMAVASYAGIVVDEQGGVDAEVSALAALPTAVRTRVVRRMALECGSPGEDLGLELVRRIDALITDWHGQGEVHLPGGATAYRSCGRLCLRPA